jgi:hypothetical protein
MLGDAGVAMLAERGRPDSENNSHDLSSGSVATEFSVVVLPGDVIFFIEIDPTIKEANPIRAIDTQQAGIIMVSRSIPVPGSATPAIRVPISGIEAGGKSIPKTTNSATAVNIPPTRNTNPRFLSFCVRVESE